MKKTLTSLALVFACFFGKAVACDCLPVVSFCQTITDENTNKVLDYLYVYLVTVTAKFPDGMKVLVTKTYHGQNNTNQELLISDGNGADCNMFTEQFEENEKLIVALHKLDDKWHLGDCGTTFLRVEDEQVIGFITPTVSEVPLSEFTSLDNCGNLGTAWIQAPALTAPIIVAPTLTSDVVHIHINDWSVRDLKVGVFDTHGMLVHQSVIFRDVAFASKTIDLSGWSAGVYFLKIERAGRMETFRVLKM